MNEVPTQWSEGDHAVADKIAQDVVSGANLEALAITPEERALVREKLLENESVRIALGLIEEGHTPQQYPEGGDTRRLMDVAESLRARKRL